MSDTVAVTQTPTYVTAQTPSETVTVTENVSTVTVASTGQTITVPDKSVEVVTVQATSETVVVPAQSVEIIEVGIQGPPGSGSDAHFEQSFTTASSVTVNHNLGKLPAVTVIDSAGDEVVGTIQHVSNNQLIATFSAPFSGVLYCN